MQSHPATPAPRAGLPPPRAPPLTDPAHRPPAQPPLPARSALMCDANCTPASNASPYKRRPGRAAWTSEEDDILLELIHRDGKGYLRKAAAEEAQKVLRDRLSSVRPMEGILTRGRKLKRARQPSVPSTAPSPAKRARPAQAVLPLESLAPATAAPQQINDVSALPPIPWSDRDDEVLLTRWQAVVEGRISWMDVCAVFPLQTHNQLLRRIQHIIPTFSKPAAGQLAPPSIKPDSSTPPDLHKQPLPRPTTTSPPSDASLRSFQEAIAALRGVPIATHDDARNYDHLQAGRPLQPPRLPAFSRSPSPAFPESRPHNLFAQPLPSSPSPATSPVVNLRPQPLYGAQVALSALSLPLSSFCHAPRSETDDYRIPTSADFLPVKLASVAHEPGLQ